MVVAQTNELAEGSTDACLLFPPQAGEQFVQLDRKNINFVEDFDDDGIIECTVLSVFAVDTCSFELDCRPGAPGDTTPLPEE